MFLSNVLDNNVGEVTSSEISEEGRKAGKGEWPLLDLDLELDFDLVLDFDLDLASMRPVQVKVQVHG